MSKPVTLSRSAATKLPNSWSNRGRDEYLHPDAYASLTRALNIAVADTGVNFQIYDALRDMDEQIALLKQNYTKTNHKGKARSSDRIYQGVRWVKKPGRPNTAVPGLSNHGSGRAIDIHPGPIQEWFKGKGREHGWDWSEGRRNGENWHFTHSTSADRYRSRGVLDHAAVQKVVGVKADGKIGTGTVAAIKKWQKANGLEADGIVGPGTAKAMGLGKKGDGAPVVVAPKPDPVVVTPAEPGRFIPRGEWLGVSKAGPVLADNPDRVQTEIYIHYPGQAATIGAASEASTKARLSGYYRSHVSGEYTDIAYNLAVDQSGNVWELRGVDRQSGANGGTVSNRRGQSILVLVGNDEAPSSAALAGIEDAIKRVRAVHPGASKVLGHQESPDASTACPGATLMALIRAGKIGTGTPAEGAPVVKSPAPAKSAGKVTEDGRLGRETATAIQVVLNASPKTKRTLVTDGRLGTNTYKSIQEHLGGNVIDGVIENQSYRPEELGNGVGPHGWEFTGRGSKGSATVRRIQRHVGVKDVDGILYEGTTKALQRALNGGKF